LFLYTRLTDSVFVAGCFSSKAIKQFLTTVYAEKRRGRKRKKVGDEATEMILTRSDLNYHKLLSAVGRYSLTKYGMTQFKSQCRLYMREKIIKTKLKVIDLPRNLPRPLKVEDFVALSKCLVRIAHDLQRDLISEDSNKITRRGFFQKSLESIKTTLLEPPFTPVDAPASIVRESMIMRRVKD